MSIREIDESSLADVPVVCRLCGTRMYALRSQIGEVMVCPDCETKNEVKSPPPKPIRKTPATDGLHEFRFVDDPVPETTPTPAAGIRLTCTKCYSPLLAQSDQAGMLVRCGKCGSTNTVPRHTEQPAANVSQLPSATNSTNLVGAKDPKKEFADRLMEKARSEVAERIEENEPEIPVAPFIQGVFQFPIYISVLPTWLIIGCGLMVIFFLFGLIGELMAERNKSIAFAVPLSAVSGILTIGLPVFFLPKLMAVFEVTSAGKDRMDNWPGVDKIQSSVMIINALALSVLPGMLIALPLGQFGVPKWFGACGVLLFFPITFLSVVESGSAWSMKTGRIRDSLSLASGSWAMFWLTSVLTVVGFALVCATLFGIGRNFAMIVTAFGASAVALIYFRLLGRLAWMITEAELKRDQQESEDDDDSE